MEFRQSFNWPAKTQWPTMVAVRETLTRVDRRKDWQDNSKDKIIKTSNENTTSATEHNIELVELEEKLHQCTNLNSHKVRGPIARVLGLVELSRLDKDIDYDWFFRRIKHEVRHIDKIIKRVSRELERIEEIKKSKEPKREKQAIGHNRSATRHVRQRTTESHLPITTCIRNGVDVLRWKCFQLTYLGNVDSEAVSNTPLLMHKRWQ